MADGTGTAVDGMEDGTAADGIMEADGVEAYLSTRRPSTSMLPTSTRAIATPTIPIPTRTDVASSSFADTTTITTTGDFFNAGEASQPLPGVKNA